MDLWGVLLLLVSMVTLVWAEVQEFNQLKNVNNLGHKKQGLHDKNHVHNQEHIMEHYDGVIDQQQNLSDEELNFHYFKVHDYDNNNMLDGIELVSALTHYHKDNEPDASRMPDTELTDMIDAILKDDDANGDGYIDYAEFIMSQRR